MGQGSLFPGKPKTLIFMAFSGEWLDEAGLELDNV
jgi:hypothetical protein